MKWLPGLTGIGTKILAGLAAAAAAIGGLLLIFSKFTKAGRDAERAEQAKRNEEFRRQADEVDRRIDAASDDELDRLRDKWTRQ